MNDIDIALVEAQERRLVLPNFDLETAWTLGARLKSLAEERNLALAIEIRHSGQTVFFYSMPGTAPANADWARRKRNSVEYQQCSSYLLSLKATRDGSTLMDKTALPMRDYATHGGSFPIRVAGAGVVGVATVSGAPQRADHSIVVQALAELCDVPLEEIALA